MLSLAHVFQGTEFGTMGILTRILTPDGDLIPPTFQADSLDEVGALEPDGIYTITRTYQSSKTVMLDEHMRRLEESARLERIDLDLDRVWLRSGLRRIIDEAGYEEARFRITIPRKNPHTALLAVEKLKSIPDGVRTAGVSAATMCIDRPNPQAKSNRWIQIREQARRKLPEWAYEGLVCTNDGEILEGFSSNFYAVLAGELRTAKDVVLSGIARKILLHAADGLIAVSFDPINRSELSVLEEALLTSSSRGILAIVKIDKHIIGSGEPGPITQELWRRYQAWVQEHLQEI
jgi:branched-subunit amino acid aminotransferase/4-amino-4-deoxychorismate lyase